MAPITRSTARPSTPVSCSKRAEYNTIQKARFFDAYDARDARVSLRAVARIYAPSLTTAHRWLDERARLGSLGKRKTRKLSQNLGQPSKVSEGTCKMLVSPSKNPVRDQQYEAQLSHFNINCKPRTLQRRLKQCTNGGQRYKQAYIQKKISPKNRRERVEYGTLYQDKSIHDLWQYVYFTDEAHLDPSSQAQGYILREQGTRVEAENIQERG